MKKILFINHKFHLKTKSNIFVQEILKSKFEVKVRTSHNRNFKFTLPLPPRNLGTASLRDMLMFTQIFNSILSFVKVQYTFEV